MYITANKFVKTLNEEDYEIGEKEKSVFLKRKRNGESGKIF